MISVFFWLSIALLVATVIFYLIFLAFIYYYHEKRTTLLIVPLLYTFDVFITGFLVICLASLAVAYAPQLWQAFLSIHVHV